MHAVTRGTPDCIEKANARSDAAHAELRTELRSGLGKVNDNVLKIVEDVGCLRGRQDERDANQQAAE